MGENSQSKSNILYDIYPFIYTHSTYPLVPVSSLAHPILCNLIGAKMFTGFKIFFPYPYRTTIRLFSTSSSSYPTSNFQLNCFCNRLRNVNFDRVAINLAYPHASDIFQKNRVAVNNPVSFRFLQSLFLDHKRYIVLFYHEHQMRQAHSKYKRTLFQLKLCEFI